MKSTNLRNLCWVLALGLAGPAAMAAAEVRFIQPERFSDAGESGRDRDQHLQQIAEHLQRQAEKFAPGKQLSFEVTDVDLAGEIEPVGRRMERLRVLRGVTSPRIEFRYLIREPNQPDRQGEVQLRDLAYQLRSSRYWDSDPMRYEKRMLDDWFQAQFVPPKKP